MKTVATELSIPEAKVVEQFLISTYTLEYLDNARREIALGNLAEYFKYIAAINQIYNSVNEEEIKNLMGR